LRRGFERLALRLRLRLGLRRRLRLRLRLRLPPPSPPRERAMAACAPDLWVPHFMHSVLRAKLWNPHDGQSQSPGRNSTCLSGLGGGRARSRLLLSLLGERPRATSRKLALIAWALFLPACGSSISNSTLSPLRKPLFLALYRWSRSSKYSACKKRSARSFVWQDTKPNCFSEFHVLTTPISRFLRPPPPPPRFLLLLLLLPRLPSRLRLLLSRPMPGLPPARQRN